MSEKELKPTSKANLGSAIEKLKKGSAEPILLQGDRNLLAFAETIFSDESRAEISVKKETRNPNGKGAHFDVYNTLRLLDNEFPFVAIYNVTGNAVLRATVISQKLQEYYDATYPKPNDVAHAARRDIARLAFRQPDATIFNGNINPGTGLIIPQLIGGYHLAHEITPKDPANPGTFIKIVKPDSTEEAYKTLDDTGYTSLERFVENQIALNTQHAEPTPLSQSEIPTSDWPSQRTSGLID